MRFAKAMRRLSVSMKSGLEGRNNLGRTGCPYDRLPRLNEVRPRRPEQYARVTAVSICLAIVSMKSGLEGRNNLIGGPACWCATGRLNEVRPRRPEQSLWVPLLSWDDLLVSMKSGLEGRNNGVPREDALSRGPVSMKSGLEGRNNPTRTTPRRRRPRCRNEVRPRRPEQL